MAASKKNGKGSKTAHVLNLLTAPGTSKESAPAGDETVAEQAPSAPVSRPLLPPILEVAQANDDSLAQQIQQALEVELDEAASLPSDLPITSVIEEVPSMDQPSVAKILETSGGKMSQDDIEKLLADNAPAEQPAPEADPAPAPPAASGGKMSQDDIEKLLAANAPAEQPAQEPEPAPAPPAASGGKMSQDDIEKLLAAANAPAEQPAQEPEPAPAPPAASGGKMSQDDIEKLLAAANAPAEQPAQEPESAPAPPAASGGKMSQDDIEKLLAAANAPAEQPAQEPEPAPAPPAASGGKMSQDDIEKLLAAANAPAEQPAQEPESAPAPPAASGGKMSQDDIEKLLAAANAPAEQPAQEPEKPAPRPPEEKAEPDITYINVMQALVEEKAPRYIKKFGLCSCKQCEADVKALTLTNLVPKYVVLSKIDRIPMLTVYEGRYNSTIFAQLTRACKTVMDHPHHNREP